LFLLEDVSCTLLGFEFGDAESVADVEFDPVHVAIGREQGCYFFVHVGNEGNILHDQDILGLDLFSFGAFIKDKVLFQKFFGFLQDFIFEECYFHCIVTS